MLPRFNKPWIISFLSLHRGLFCLAQKALTRSLRFDPQQLLQYFSFRTRGNRLERFIRVGNLTSSFDAAYAIYVTSSCEVMEELLHILDQEKQFQWLQN